MADSSMVLNILLRATTNQANSAIKGFVGALSDINPALGVTAGVLAGVGAAAIAVGIKATKMAADYEQGMRKVEALTGSSQAQMQQYDAGLKRLAENAGVAPTKLTDGLYNVISAGYKGADAMNVLTLATEDAKIGMTSSTVTTDALTNVLRSFGVQSKDITRVNGEMLETVTLGKATFEQYAQSIVKASSSAVQFHVPMETMNAAWATMTSSGIRAAQASTDFQQSLKVMYGSIGTVSDSLHKNGIAFDEAKFNAMSYGDKVKYLNTALQEANAKHVKITGVTIQAAQAISTIAQHISDYNANLKTLSDRQAMIAKTQDAWNTTQAGFNQIMSRLKATFDVILISLGQKFLPILTNIATAIAPVLTSFADWLMSSNGLSKSLGGVGDVLGSIGHDFAVMFSQIDVGEFVASFKNLENTISGFLPDVQGLGKSLKQMDFAFVTEQIGTFIAQGMGKLTDVIDAVNKELQYLKPTFNEVAGVIGGVFTDHMKTGTAIVKDLSQWFNSSLMPAIREAMPGFQSLAHVMITDVVPGLVKLWAIGQQVVDKVMPPLVKIFEAAAPVMIKLAGVIAGDLAIAMKFLMPYILQAAQAIGQFAGEIATRVAPIVINFFNSIGLGMKILQQVWNAVWPSLAPILQGLWDELVGIVKIAWALLSGFIKIGLDVLSGNWGQAWQDMKDMLSGIWDGIKQLVSGGIETVLGTLKAGLNGIVALFQWLWDTLVGHSIVPDMINSIINWFAQLPGRALDAISSLAGNIGGFFSSLAGQAVSWGQSLIQNFVSGIQSMAGNVTNAVSSIWQNISDHFPHSPPKKGPGVDLPNWGPRLVNMFADDIKKHTPATQKAAEGMMGSVLNSINKYQMLIMQAQKSGNTKLAAKYKQDKSLMQEQLSMYEKILKQAGFSYNTNNPNNPINFGKTNNLAGTGTGYVNQFTKDIAGNSAASQQAAEKMMRDLLTTIQKYQMMLLDAEKSGNKQRISQTKSDLTILNQQLSLYEKAVKAAGDKYDLNNLKNPIAFKATTGVLNAPGSSSTSTGSTGSGSSNPTYAIYNYNTNLHIDKIEVPIGTTQQQVRTIVDMVEKELGKRQRMQGVIAQSSGVAA